MYKDGSLLIHSYQGWPVISCGCVYCIVKIMYYMVLLLIFFWVSHFHGYHCFLSMTIIMKCYTYIRTWCLNNSYTHAPRSLRIIKTRRPKAVAPERSEDATKGLRVYKIHRLHGACI